MFRIEAPFPLLQTTLLLPSPNLGNSRNLAASIQTLRAMDGTVYTHAKSRRGRRVHQWTFLMARHKHLEAVEFARVYGTSLVRVVDHEDIARVGWITINPVEFAGEGRAGGWPGDEAYSVTIHLEERV